MPLSWASPCQSPAVWDHSPSSEEDFQSDAIVQRSFHACASVSGERRSVWGEKMRQDFEMS